MSTGTPSIQAFQCTIETLTPVHVGSGEVYYSDIEFFRQKMPTGGAILKVLPRNWLKIVESRLSHDQIEQLVAAIEDGGLKRWLEKSGLFKELTRHTLDFTNKENPPREIREHIRDGNGNPLLPGSSLKGAFRTSVVKLLVRTDPKLQQFLDSEKTRLAKWRGKLKFADAELLKHVLGTDAKYNLMRTLRVGDIAFKCSDLALFKVLTLSLKAKGTFAPKGHVNVVEGLNTGVISAGMISFDGFLQAAAKGKCSDLFGFRAKLDRDGLLMTLRKLSRHFLENEIAFLEGKSGLHIEQLRTHYESLLKRLDSLGKAEAMCNLGWGIGWRGMTGELLSPDDLALNNCALRRKLKLAPNTNHLSYPFPKTRKVAITGNDALPMGWVVLRLDSMEEVRRQMQAEAARKAEEKRKFAEEARYQAELEAMPKEERLLLELEKGILDNTAIGQHWDEILSLEGELQLRAARQLERIWKNAGDWNVKPKKKKQYEKVQQVRKILGKQ